MEDTSNTGLSGAPQTCGEPLVLIRNQQVIGSNPIVGSSRIKVTP
jgi:hypothetical protein